MRLSPMHAFFLLTLFVPAGPGRVLIPSLHGQPISMKVVSTRFEDISVICPHPRLSQQVSTR